MMIGQLDDVMMEGLSHRWESGSGKPLLHLGGSDLPHGIALEINFADETDPRSEQPMTIGKRLEWVNKRYLWIRIVPNDIPAEVENVARRPKNAVHHFDPVAGRCPDCR